MVKITDGTIIIELTCEEWALMGETPMTGFTVTENTCSIYSASFFAPFASFDFGTGNGTVTSVGLALPGITYDVTDSPVTDAGVLTGTYIDQPAKYVLIGPVSGADASPTWRQMVIGDLSTGGATTGQVITYNGTTLVFSTPTVYTDEQAQDAVGSILTNNSEIAFTYNDGANTITALLVVTGVTAGTYGSASVVPVFAVDSKGRLTSVTNTNIAISASAIISGILPIARGGTGIGTLGTAFQYLRVNAGATGLEYATLPTGITGTGVAGRVAFWDSNTNISNDDALLWDSINNRLTIGAVTAFAQLGVSIAAVGTGTYSLIHAKAETSGLVICYVQNTNTTSGKAVMEINTLGTTANSAEASVRFQAGDTWQFGVLRQATGGLLVLAKDTTLLTSRLLIADSNLDASIGPSPTILTGITVNFTGTGGIKLPVGSVAQRAASLFANTGTLRYNNAFGGAEILNGKQTYSRITCIGSPTLGAGAGAGTGATLSVQAGATDKKGVIRIIAGTSPGAAGSTILTFNYNTPYQEVPVPVLGRANGTGLGINFYTPTANITTTNFWLVADTALTAGATYDISYIIQD